MLAVVVASLLFAVNGTVAKLAMQAGLSPTRLVELRSVGSAVILMTVALLVVWQRMRLRGRELGRSARAWPGSPWWPGYGRGSSSTRSGSPPPPAPHSASLCLATYYLLAERLVAHRDPLSTQAWSLAFAGALDGATAPLWVLVAWIVVLGTVVPYTLVLALPEMLAMWRAGQRAGDGSGNTRNTG